MDAIVLEQIFLSGIPNGIIEVKTDNWNGLCFKVPYSMLKEIKTNSLLAGSPAIYLLFGEKDGQSCVYVGESENPYKRLLQHTADSISEFWNEALIFVNGMINEPLEKSQIKYMESVLHQELLDSHERNKMFDVLNGNKPKQSTLTGSSKIKTDKFVKNLKFVVEAMGYKLFEFKTKPKSNNLFEISSKGVLAYGERTPDGFMVMKGSTVASAFTNSTTECFKATGQNLRDQGIIVDNKFTVDYTFKTPSGASVIILGRNSNGLLEWKKNGKSLKEIESIKID